jgi:hypothetical protein
LDLSDEWILRATDGRVQERIPRLRSAAAARSKESAKGRYGDKDRAPNIGEVYFFFFFHVKTHAQLDAADS